MNATVTNVKEVLVEADILVNISGMKLDLPLSEQGVDSLDMVNVYLLLEEKFDIKIPDEDLDKVQTINGIIEYINYK